jgi:hypothetical protein
MFPRTRCYFHAERLTVDQPTANHENQSQSYFATGGDCRLPTPDCPDRTENTVATGPCPLAPVFQLSGIMLQHCGV